jgi:valyl-tRNA synthetase
MSISTVYNPSDIEKELYQQWESAKLFAAKPDDREAYSIVIPPPNVTGILHMGHMLNNTIQDILIRKARLEGKNACWVPGTDHASIATEAKVVQMLKEQGLSKESVGREKFLEHAFEWKEKYGGIILEQLKALGCACDWDRTRFTMETDLSDAVIDVFIDLHQRGYIYRGVRMINWDPVGKTALSDEEVMHEEQNSHLYYIKYFLENSEEYITIATTRPETIMGDTAVCVHPEDPRYAHLKGKKCKVPLVDRWVPIIQDDYIDMEFGTGALKVTPAHDINDYNIGERHNLETIDVLNDDGTISLAGQVFIGQDRFEARKNAVKKLEEIGVLLKKESIVNKVGKSERTKAAIEPRLSAQWFVDMKKFMADHPQVLESVNNGEINFYPSKFKSTYNYWLENIKDWCISRQLWWGHRIPAWYTPNGTIIIAKTAEEALAKSGDKNLALSDLRQDEDVLDTWFSSWLWPISVFDGFKDSENPDYQYFYPTSDLVTGPDIIFFWVARMIMAGYSFADKKPFNNVYFTGIVRDSQRRKMSKSLGNSPDPLELMAKYGTDGVRMGLMLSAPAGNDLLFQEELCEQGRNFCNKLWNSYRLIQGWDVVEERDAFAAKNHQLIHSWMQHRLEKAIFNVEQYFKSFKISEALMELYKLTRDDFSGWYLEMIKPPYGKPIAAADKTIAIEIFEQILKLLHPFMPFVTDYLWKELTQSNDYLLNQQWSSVINTEEAIPELVFKLISEVRAKRNELGISPKLSAVIYTQQNVVSKYVPYSDIISKLGNVSGIENATNTQAIASLVGTDEVGVFFEGYEKKVDVEAVKKEIKRLEGFLLLINKKLENEKFMANASQDVIAREQAKKSDTLQKLEILKGQMAGA